MAPERRTTLELDRETIQRIVQNLDPGLVADGFARLHGGSTEVYRIDFAGADCEPLVLKIYPDEPEWGPAKEKLVAGWFTELTPLAPKWLAIDESRSLLPLRYALLPLLPGRSLRGWVAEPDIDNAYRQMGALLRHIHAMPMPAYGYVVGHGIAKPMPTNADYMTSAFEDVFRRFRDFGGDADLGRRLQQLAEGSFDLLRESSGAVLCHDDLHQGNVLALRTDPGGLQLSGLVDFGNARAADKLFDLAKALFCSAHEDPRSRKPILEGYGALDHPDIERGALALYAVPSGQHVVLADEARPRTHQRKRSRRIDPGSPHDDHGTWLLTSLLKPPFPTLALMGFRSELHSSLRYRSGNADSFDADLTQKAR